jgi:hypothetical protein
LEGNPSDEIILAEEEAVVNHGVGVIQEAESDMDVGKQTQGNLVLTNLRLIYAHGAEKEIDIPTGMIDPFATLGKKRLIISDVEELDNIPSDPFNTFIRISTITSVKGHHIPGFAPKLEVRWTDGGLEKATEFIEQETGRSRRRNLNDWAPIIERLKAGKQKITILPPAPDRDSLEGRILLVLDDMQEKGLITIESEVEEKFKMDLEPDQVREACEKLVAQGLIRRTTSINEDPFYLKVSPLGEDDMNQ